MENTATTKMDLTGKSISDLARIIRADWASVNFGAKPYLNAMRSIENLNDAYGCEDGRTQVLYFLSNATSWRGDVARQVKAELNRRLKARR